MLQDGDQGIEPVDLLHQRFVLPSRPLVFEFVAGVDLVHQFPRGPHLVEQCGVHMVHATDDRAIETGEHSDGLVVTGAVAGRGHDRSRDRTDGGKCRLPTIFGDSIGASASHGGGGIRHFLDRVRESGQLPSPLGRGRIRLLGGSQFREASSDIGDRNRSRRRIVDR
ncbi:hypothetical protein [Nocardia cyriacigeorgica]|uniref:hypothetical protein n=1 Tax=Nocardia cyriacigeorgica TaxID=135487 RepID=UPI0024590CE2|nr:hypothetical protein [Nocardia cyriacigeorgica]